MTVLDYEHVPTHWREQRRDTPAKRHLKILLGEDNPGDAALVEHAFSRDSLFATQVVQADSLASTILALTHDDFDAVVLDMNLPDSEGLETILLALQQVLDIPLIVLSSEQEERIALEAIGLGAQDYVLKSRLLQENLSRVISHAIERHGLRLALEKRIAMLESQRQNFRALIADNADAMIVIDQAGRICFANQAAETMLGRPHEGLVGSTFGIPLAGSDFSEVELMKADGTPLVADMRVMATSWEQRPAYIASFRDVTKNKETERLLTIARQSAELSDQFKSQFLANVSHELRTPLNAISGYAELMLLEIHGAVGHSEYRGYLNAIHSSSQELSGLINRLLDLSKAEAGALGLDERQEAVDSLLAEVIDRYRDEAEGRGLRFSVYDCAAGATLHCDPERVQDVVGQLLSNSCKFTDEGGKVRLSVRRTDDGELEILVTDSGAGMEAEQLLRAFRPFNASDGPYAVRPGQGAGLGLPLAKTLVELHGGTLDLCSEAGQGTMARVVFPSSRVGFASETIAAAPWKNGSCQTLALQ